MTILTIILFLISFASTVYYRLRIEKLKEVIEIQERMLSEWRANIDNIIEADKEARRN